AIERQHAVRTRIIDAARGGRRPQLHAIRLPVPQRPRRASSKHVLLEERERGAAEPAEAAEARAEVAGRMELRPQPRAADALPVVREDAAAGITARERVEHRLGSEQAALHRGVRALDLGVVQESGVAADEETAR